MSDMNKLKDWLHELHGNRICTVGQHLNNGNVREAAVAQGELNGLRMAIAALESQQDDIDRNRDDLHLHYHALSKQRLEVERAATDNGTDTPLRGLE